MIPCFHRRAELRPAAIRRRHGRDVVTIVDWSSDQCDDDDQDQEQD